jgi:hypothetical protein
VIEAFGAVCDKFSELSRSDQGRSVPLRGGTGSAIRCMLKHPIKGYISIVREGFRAQASIGTLAYRFPLELMAAFLSQFSKSQLKAIEALSEIYLRRVKSMVTDNPAFKVGLPIGSAYAVLEVSNKLVTVPGSSLDLVRKIIASPTTQVFMGYLFEGFIFTFVAFALQYLFMIGQ